MRDNDPYLLRQRPDWWVNSHPFETREPIADALEYVRFALALDGLLRQMHEVLGSWPAVGYYPFKKPDEFLPRERKRERQSQFAVQFGPQLKEGKRLWRLILDRAAGKVQAAMPFEVEGEIVDTEAE